MNNCFAESAFYILFDKRNKVVSFSEIFSNKNISCFEDIHQWLENPECLPSIEEIIKNSDSCFKNVFKHGMPFREVYISGKKLIHKNNVVNIVCFQKNICYFDPINHKDKEWIFRTIEYIEQAVWIIDFTERKIQFNKEWLKIHEAEENQLVNNIDFWYGFIHPDDREKVMNKMGEVMRFNEKSYEDEYRIITKKGNVRWVSNKGNILRVGKEQKLLATGILMDISNKMKPIQVLQKAGERYKNIFENAVEGILILNEYGIILNRNEAASEITGYNADEILGLNFRFLFSEGSDITSQLKRLTLQESIKFENTLLRKNKELIFVEISIKKHPDNTIQAFIRDISQQKNTESALTKTIQTLNTLFESVPYALFLLGNDFVIIDCNQEAYSLLELKNKEELLGHYITEFIPVSERQHSKEFLKQLTIKGKPHFFQTEFIPTSGYKKLCEISASFLTNSTEENEGFVWLVKEIAWKQLSEFNIQQSEFHLKKAQEISKIASWEWNINDDTIFWSDTMYSLFSLDKTKSNPSVILLASLLYQKNIKNKNAALKILSNQIDSESIELKTKDTKGNPKWLKFERSFQFEKGVLIRISGTLQDITETKSIEQRIVKTIIETEERERKRFAEDIHDELAPLLSSIKMYLGMINSERANENEKKAFLEQSIQLVNQAIDNSKEIANDLMSNLLRDFGLEEAIKSYFIGLNNLRKTQFSLVSHMGKARFNNSTERLLFRCAKELANNTLKYAKASNARISLYKKKNVLKFIYSDNGIGFDTKEYNNRMGMGIKNIMSRVKLADGFCSILSDKGMGVEVLIEFPIL